MKPEIEATFLNADHRALREVLRKLGAKPVSSETLMRRTIYDYPDLRLDKQAAWIRVRDEGGRVTMGYKQRQAESIDGMKEIEFEVPSYLEAKQFLEAIGLSVKAEQESKREVWKHLDCEIMLDTWPWIPPFVEVEGPSEEVVRRCAAELGQDWSQAVFDSTDAVYRHYFNVTRTEISTIPIQFGEPPKQLADKRL